MQYKNTDKDINKDFDVSTFGDENGTKKTELVQRIEKLEQIMEKSGQRIGKLEQDIEQNTQEIREIKEKLNTLAEELQNIYQRIQGEEYISLANRRLINVILYLIGAFAKKISEYDMENYESTMKDFEILTKQEYEKNLVHMVSTKKVQQKKTLSNKEKNLYLIRDRLRKVEDHRLTTKQIMELCCVNKMSASRYMKYLEQCCIQGEKYIIDEDRSDRGQIMNTIQLKRVPLF